MFTYRQFSNLSYDYRTGGYPLGQPNTHFQFQKKIFFSLFNYYPGTDYTEDDLYLINSYHLLEKEGTKGYKKENLYAVKVMLKDLTRGRKLLSENHKIYLRCQEAKQEKEQTMEKTKETKKAWDGAWPMVHELIIQQKLTDIQIFTQVKKAFPDARVKLPYISIQRSDLNHGRKKHEGYNSANMKKLVRIEDPKAPAKTPGKGIVHKKEGEVEKVVGGAKLPKKTA